MNYNTALRLLKDLNMSLDSEEINKEYFFSVLKNYCEVKEK